MTHISVPTGEPYEVILGKGLLDTAGERLREMLDPETAVEDFLRDLAGC